MIAITGAAGFIGSNLAHRLAAEGADLLLVDHPLTAAKSANLVGLKVFRFMEHDQFLDDLAGNRLHPESIYHLGACSATTELNWDYLQRNNIEYSRHLWNWCMKNKVPFLYASSAATYGDGRLGFDDHLHPSKIKPLNLYGKSKNDFDCWALSQIETPPRWAGLKFFNVYGPREIHKGRMASVALQTFLQIRATGGMKLFRSNDPAYPDGGQLRDFVFVEDCVAHLFWLARHDHRGGLYNSGTGNARSFLDLAKSVFSAMGIEPNISFIEMPTDLAKQYQNYTQATTDKLRQAGCNLSPTRLEDGVKRTVEWLSR